MPIVFEPTKDYERLKGDLHQTLVDNYLLGKEFSSLEEALGQTYEGKSLLEHGFYVGDAIVKQPETLPIVINKATIFVKVHFEKQHPSTLNHLPVLEARVVD